ncbi:MAG TPA: hypothetical protein VFU89_02605, partial [Rhabdochlamydiaceae bacterium]|nr:hypothetical protein [Rhabdochlamydiaceae bacterium]
MDKGLKVMSDRGFEVAFRGRKIGVLEYKRMYYPTYPAACDRADPAMFLFKEKKTINYSQATPVACFLVINFVNAIHRSYIEPIFNHTPTCFQGMQKY